MPLSFDVYRDLHFVILRIDIYGFRSCVSLSQKNPETFFLMITKLSTQLLPNISTRLKTESLEYRLKVWGP